MDPRKWVENQICQFLSPRNQFNSGTNQLTPKIVNLRPYLLSASPQTRNGDTNTLIFWFTIGKGKKNSIDHHRQHSV